MPQKRIILPESATRGQFNSDGDLGILLPKESQSIYGYNPVSGSLMRGSYSARWWRCRELFHSQTRSYKILFRTKFPGRTAACIEHAQNLLKLPQEDRIVVKRTNLKGIVMVPTTAWWNKNHRRQLLTILLRASKKFVIKNPDFDKIAKSDKYLSKNPAAFKRFLRGYTDLKQCKFPGWVRLFNGKTRKEVQTLLVKPNAD